MPDMLPRVGHELSPAVPCVPARRTPAAPRGGAIQVPEVSSSADPVALLRALRRRWVLALVVALFVAPAAGAAAWFLLPPAKYTARAVLQVATRPPQVAFATIDNQQGARDEYQSYQRTQVGLIKSNYIIGPALQKLADANPKPIRLRMLEDKEDAAEWIAKELEVGFAEGSELLRISLSGDNAAELATLINVILDSYKEKVVDAEKTRRSARLDNLMTISNRYTETLGRVQRAEKELTMTLGSRNDDTLEYRRQFNIQQMAAIQGELTKVETDIMKGNIDLEALTARQAAAGAAAKTPKRPTVSKEQVQQLIEQQESTQRLVDELAISQQKLSRMDATLGRLARHPGSDPARSRLAADVRDKTKKLSQHREQLRGWATQQLTTNETTERVDDIASLKDQIALWTKLKAVLTQQKDTLKSEAENFNKDTINLQTKHDAKVEIEDAAKKIRTDIESLKVELDAPSRTIEIERASVPRVRDEAKRTMMVGAIALGALVFVLAAIAWVESLARRIDSPDEVVRGLGMRLVGALPALPGKARQRSLGADDAGDLYWQTLMIDSIDAARTMILHAAKTEPTQIVMVTSALGGEGKTSLSCHLATSLARAGRRTLLIDCDLRSPSVNRVYGLGSTPGVCELLRGEATDEEAIRTLPDFELAVLPAGQCDAPTIRALSRGGIRPIFDRLRDQYEFIVVDSSPVLPIADALMVAQHIDAVVFSILRDVSRAPKIRAANERLATLGVRMLGAIVTGTREDLYSAKYRYPLALPAKYTVDDVAGSPTS